MPFESRGSNRSTAAAGRAFKTTTMISHRLSAVRSCTELPFTSFRSLSAALQSRSVAVSKSRAPIRGMADNAAGHCESVHETVLRYSSKSSDKRGKGVSMMWFRNDLRLVDNEALMRAYRSSEAVVPVYCLDPRHFGKTYHFGFPKTGDFRAQFLLESLADLKKNLRSRGLDLVVRHGKPEEVLPTLAELFRVHTIYAQEETCSEELQVDKAVRRTLGPKVKLELVWGLTMYHLNDLPFAYSRLPDVYTQFRKAVESSSQVRPCLRLPLDLGPLPESLEEELEDVGQIPALAGLGVVGRTQSPLGVMHFTGGETEALSRLNHYFWEKDRLRIYKETRNGMLGADYSTKFSPWLALGCISPRLIHDEVKRYEQQRVANTSTYWVLFELIWRDYFRFLSLKYGNAIFHLEGPRRVTGIAWSQNKELFEAWRTGRTGYPLVDANMKELEVTGYMSNRGRQIVCSFLVRDMGIDWRMGAEWFETCLIDHDPCSNYGNWTYGAGVGNDPREDRYFSIPKQAQNYDPEGEYVAHWIPELAKLPKDARHFPRTGYMKPVVPLRFQTTPGSSRPRQQQTRSLKL